MKAAISDEIRDEVAAAALHGRQTQARLEKLREVHADETAVLDPIIDKIRSTCLYLEKAEADLRTIAVEQRT